jgi:hypothetical protein
MSHMSQRRIAAGQSTRNVGHHHAGLMSHMSHPGGPPMSLMSHMGHSAVPPSAQFSGPMGHVGHDPRPFPTWPSPPRRPAARRRRGMPTAPLPGHGDVRAGGSPRYWPGSTVSDR